MTDQPADARDDLLLWLGMLLWVIAIAVRWPAALSMSDEVSYVAQAKLLLDGHLAPLADTPGVWHLGPKGPQAICYPFLYPILIAPFVALNPRSAFILSLASALAITWVASRALRSWGRRPIWALVALAHPTVVLIARTLMADLPLSAFAVGAWWALRNDKRLAAVILLVLVVGAKVVGVPIAAALIAGEALRSWRAILSRDRQAIAHLAWAVAGLILGLVFVIGLNLAGSGKLWYEYDHWFLGGPPFALKYLPASGRRHLMTLLLLPPLLFVGAFPFWRRREWSALLVVGGFTAMMATYYFVDTGRIWVETMILSPRLILPAVAFLLIGYADALAAVAERIARGRRWYTPAVIVAPAIIALAISVKHAGWQKKNAGGREAAAAVAAELGVHEIGLTEPALKDGMLYPGKTVAVGSGHDPKVVLCHKNASSYREGQSAVPCELPRYDIKLDGDEFRVLVRRD